MIDPGVSDSLASGQADPAACPVCGAKVRVEGDSCVRCLLQTALEDPGEPPDESFEDVLAEVNIPDTDWRIGNYQILEEIGRGGMGVIYRARQRHSKRIVALKRVLSHHGDSPESLRRFQQEAEAAASLDHPNILPIFEVGESEGLPFFTMKFAPGGSLQHAGPVLRGRTRECVQLVAKVARAVAHAHAAGILHRDLKPGNVLLDARGEPLVSDFGLAKWVDTNSQLTRSLAIYGTPGFIAPEQASGPSAALTPAADVYSLGAILFDLLTGHAPFRGEHALAVIREAADKPAPKLRTILPQIDRDLETIVARCLEREPRARYQSAADVADDLDRWLQGRPIVARPVSFVAQAWRWARRNPPLAATAAALLLLALVAIGRQLHLQNVDRQLRQQQLAVRSVAVLPFLDLDTAQADGSITRAVAAALQESLANYDPARIIPLPLDGAWAPGAGTPEHLKEANREASARTVLTGTRRVVDGKLRLTIRLMNPASAAVLLSRTVEVPAGTDASAAAARAVASDVNTILSASDWTTLTATQDPGMQNPEARAFIRVGREQMLQQTLQSYDHSIRALERAVQLEPNSATAHAYLAIAASSRMYYVPDPAYLARAESAAAEAVRLAPDSSLAHRALGGVLYQKGRYAESLQEQLRAVELGGPEERAAGLLGMTFDKLGDPARAVSWFAIARQLEVRPGDFDVLMGNAWAVLGEDQRAEAAYQRYMDLRPELSGGWVGLCRLRIQQGRLEEATRLAREAQIRFPNDMDADEAAALASLCARDYEEAERLYRALAERTPEGGLRHDSSVSYAAALAWLRGAMGDHAASEQMLEKCLQRELQLLEEIPHSRAILYRVAAVEASLGRTEAALDRLEQAADAGWIDYRTMLRDPRFDSISTHPRFQAVVHRLQEKVVQLRSEALRLHGSNGTAGKKLSPK